MRLSVLVLFACALTPTSYAAKDAGKQQKTLFISMRPRNYRVDKGGGVDYRRFAAQAAGVSPASR
jgi:hypothetical protein